MLTVSNASLTIQNKKLLTNIDLSLEKGKLYGLIGHNGSGKSTLIKLLAGEQVPHEGSIILDNQLVHKMPAKKLAKNIGYLPQKLPDAQSFTVAELVMLGRYPWQKWLQKPSQTDIDIVTKAMQQTQIDGKAGQLVATLSGGERARAWLAMCLAQQTQYLLLDEPLAALDIVYQVEIMALIRKLVTQQNLGVVLIVHDINLAAQFCDELIALKKGHLCHKGTTSETINQEVLAKIFGVNLHILDHPSNGNKVAVI